MAPSVNYIIKVTEIDGSLQSRLTNSVPQTNNVGQSNVQYYCLRVLHTAYRVDFEVLNPSGNVDLYIDTFRFPLQAKADHFYKSERTRSPARSS